MIHVANLKRPALWAIILAFACLYISWGTTYLAIREGVKTLPPALFGPRRHYDRHACPGLLLPLVAGGTCRTVPGDGGFRAPAASLRTRLRGALPLPRGGSAPTPPPAAVGAARRGRSDRALLDPDRRFPGGLRRDPSRVGLRGLQPFRRRARVGVDAEVASGNALPERRTEEKVLLSTPGRACGRRPKRPQPPRELTSRRKPAQGHSCRSATTRSRSAARRAGMKLAAAAIPIISR